jgi:HEAT repeat protein
MRKRIVLIGTMAALVIGFLLSTDSALAIDEKFDHRLKQKVEKAVKSLENKKGNIQREAKNDLVNWGAHSVEPLIAVVRDWEKQPADLRVVCVDILGRIKDKRAVSVIIDVLNEKKMTMRYNAARALGSIGVREAAPPLIKLLGDNEWQVRFYAVEALGKIGDKSAAKPLANLLLTDSSEKVRFAAIEALDKIDGRTEYRAVLEAFSDKDPKIRSYAVELSSSWMLMEAVPAISSMLKSDRSNKVRASSAYALGIYANYAAFPALIGALSDDYKDVRIYALESLKKMSGQNYRDDKQEWNHWFELNKDKVLE